MAPRRCARCPFVVPVLVGYVVAGGSALSVFLPNAIDAAFVVQVEIVKRIADERRISRDAAREALAGETGDCGVRISEATYRVRYYVREVLQAAHLHFLLAVLRIVLHVDFVG